MRTLWRWALWVPTGIAITDTMGCVLRVEGDSMHPTLHGSGYMSDLVLVEKISYKWLHKYQRGDVAVFWAPDQPHQQLIKRIIAMEQDVVWDSEKNTPHKIPQGRCWVEGDNPDPAASGDSRNMYGPVHLGLMEGRVTWVVWPPWRAGPLPRTVNEDKLVWRHERHERQGSRAGQGGRGRAQGQGDAREEAGRGES